MIGVPVVLASAVLYLVLGGPFLGNAGNSPDDEASEYYANLRRDAARLLSEIADDTARELKSALSEGLSEPAALAMAAGNLQGRDFEEIQAWLIEKSDRDRYYVMPGNEIPVETVRQALDARHDENPAILFQNRIYYLTSREIEPFAADGDSKWILAEAVRADMLLRSADTEVRIANIATEHSAVISGQAPSDGDVDFPLYSAYGEQIGRIAIRTTHQAFVDKYLWDRRIILLCLLPIINIAFFIYLIHRYFSSYASLSTVPGNVLRWKKPAVKITGGEELPSAAYIPELTVSFGAAGESVGDLTNNWLGEGAAGSILGIIGQMGYSSDSLRNIIESLLKDVPHSGGAVFALNELSERWEILADYNLDNDFIRNLTSKPEGCRFLDEVAGIFGRTDAQRIGKTGQRPKYANILPGRGNLYGYQLMFDHRPIGLIMFITPMDSSPGGLISGLSDRMIDLLSFVAYAVMLERDSSSRKEVSRILQETSLAISSTLDLPTVLKIVAHRVADYSRAAYCMILLRTSNSDEVEVASIFNKRREAVDTPVTEIIRLAEFPGLARAIQADGTTTLDQREISALSKKEKLFLGADSVSMITILPIAHSSKFVGSLLLAEDRHGDDGHMGEDTLVIIRAIASQAASAIENARLHGFIKRKVDQLTASCNVSAAINSQLEIAPILNGILEITQEYLNFNFSVIYSVDSEKKLLEPMAFRGFSPAKVGTEFKVKENDSVAGKAAAAGEPVKYDDKRSDVKLEPSFIGARSELAVPIKISDRVVGVFCVGSEERDAFTDFDRDFLQSLADQLAVAMEKLRLFQQEKERAGRIRMIYEFSRKTSRSLDTDEILEMAARSVREAFECHLVIIMLRRNQADSLYLARQSTLPHLKLPGEGFTIKAGTILDKSMSERRSLYSADTERDRGHVPIVPGLRSEICVPIVSGEQIIGLLALGSIASDDFSWDDIDTIEALCDILTVAVEKSRLFLETTEKAERLALIDKINTAISTALDPESFFSVVTRAVSDNAGYRWTLLIVPEGDSFRCKAGYAHESGSTIDPVPALDILKNRLGKVFLSRTPEFVSLDELSEHSDSAKLESVFAAGIRHLVILPIGDSEKCEAALLVGSIRHDGFTERDLSLLEDITVHLKSAWRNARLYEELKVAYHQLQEAQEQVIQTEKLRALGEMSSGVVHDFNNILAAILGRVQLLLQKLNDLNDEKWLDLLQRNLSVIETAVEDGSRILSRISEFTKRSPSGEFMALGVDEIIADVIEMTKPRWHDLALFNGKRIELKFNSSGRLSARGNPSELREVFTNLINNAVDAIEGDGVIEISAGIEADRVKISVADTGHGMTDEIRKRIFEPFFTTKGKNGTGLGLSMAYGIINRHGGSIDVESFVNEGTRFEITLPFDLQTEPPSMPDKISETKDLKGKILVVDDEESLRDILAEVLESMGHEVETVSGGMSALEYLSRVKYDLVITDLGMDDISGWELADRIYSAYPDTRIVMATGWGAQVEQGSLAIHHVNSLISKPFRISEISRTVHDVLSRPRDEVFVV